MNNADLAIPRVRLDVAVSWHPRVARVPAQDPVNTATCVIGHLRERKERGPHLRPLRRLLAQQRVRQQPAVELRQLRACRSSRGTIPAEGPLLLLFPSFWGPFIVEGLEMCTSWGPLAPCEAEAEPQAVRPSRHATLIHTSKQHI